MDQLHVQEFFEKLGEMDVPEGIQEAESEYWGGVADFGDPNAAYMVQRMPGYFDYRGTIQDLAREYFGESFTVYRALTKDAYEEWESGADLGPMSVTMTPGLAYNWGRLAMLHDQAMMTVSFQMSPEDIVMRGKLEEAELVIDGNNISFHQIQVRQPDIREDQEEQTKDELLDIPVKWLPTPQETTFKIWVEPEDEWHGDVWERPAEPEDAEAHDQMIAEIGRRLEHGDLWAFGCVFVAAEFVDEDEDGDEKTYQGYATLGHCSYEDDEDFMKNSGYLPQMMQEAYDDMIKDMKRGNDGVTVDSDGMPEIPDVYKAEVEATERGIYEDKPVYKFVGVICFRNEANPEVMIIKRGGPPEEGKWACPGGHIDKGEGPWKAAFRELKEETGVSASEMHELGPGGKDCLMFWGAVARDRDAKAKDDAEELRWCSVNDLPEMAFGNNGQIARAVKKWKRSLKEGLSTNFYTRHQFYKTRDPKKLAELKKRMKELGIYDENDPQAVDAWIEMNKPKQTEESQQMSPQAQKLLQALQRHGTVSAIGGSIYSPDAANGFLMTNTDMYHAVRELGAQGIKVVRQDAGGRPTWAIEETLAEPLAAKIVAKLLEDYGSDNNVGYGQAAHQPMPVYARVMDDLSKAGATQVKAARNGTAATGYINARYNDAVATVHKVVTQHVRQADINVHQAYPNNTYPRPFAVSW